jgi:hypothetical protein
MKKIQYSLILILRIVQVLNTILVLGLSANTVHGTRSISRSYSGYYYTYSYYNATDAFTIFLAVWTLLVLAYLLLAPVVLPVTAIPILSLIIELITVIFWFSDWIALAALWAPFSCGGVSYCGTGKASAAFAAVNWVLFLATFVLIIVKSVPFLKSGLVSTKERFAIGGILPSVAAPPVPTTTDIEQQQAGGVDLDTNLSNKETFSPQNTLDTSPNTGFNTQQQPQELQQPNDVNVPPAGTNL